MRKSEGDRGLKRIRFDPFPGEEEGDWYAYTQQVPTLMPRQEFPPGAVTKVLIVLLFKLLLNGKVKITCILFVCLFV